MKSLRLYGIVLLLLLCVGKGMLLSAEENPKIYKQVKTLLEEQKYDKAYKIFGKYAAKHSNDIYAQWIMGQIAFRAKKPEEAIEIYEANIAKHPEATDLKIDYCGLLVKAGKLNKAEKVIESYLPYLNGDASLYFLLAQTQFWKADYLKAKGNIEKALWLTPDNKDFKNLQEEIQNMLAPWVSLGGKLDWDNQPLSKGNTELKAGKYFNAYFNTELALQMPIYQNDSDKSICYGLQLANSSYFSSTKTSVGLQVGFEKQAFTNELNLIWQANIKQNIWKHLNLNLSGGQSPYLSTVYSLYHPYKTSNVGAVLSWDKETGINGQVSADCRLIDNNKLYNLGGWAVSPALKLWILELKAGYGFAFSSSEKDVYQSADTSNTGFYPYFSPKNMQVHKLIANINIKATQNLKLSITGSYGIYGSIDAPSLYHYMGANYETVWGIYYLKTDYNPYHIEGNLSWDINKYLAFRAGYAFNNINYYYSYHSAFASIKLKL